MQHQQLLLDFTEKYYHGFCQLDNTPRTIIINLDLDKALTQAGIATVKDQCLLEHEFSPQEGLARAACAFSDDSAHAQRIYDYASRQWLAFATPVLSNGGAKRGLPISCFINKVGDSREGLAAHYDENLWFSTSGGGCGSDWSSVRSNGTKTSKGNKTTGVIPFIKVSDSLTAASWQGSTRRGAAAVYLSVSHPEIEEFIEIRKPTGDANRRSHNLHNAVSIPDAFMLAVEQGSGWELRDPHTDEVVKVVDARTLWMSILSMRLSTGEPYLFFEDTANKALPEHLKNRGKRIYSSNLCVAPETLVLTKYGHKPIFSLENYLVDVWNGLEWSQVEVKKTGINQELIKVSFSDNSFIECTPYHKFYIQDTYSKNSVRCVEAKDLVLGDKLEKWNLPVDCETLITDPAVDMYSQGFYAGDGVKNSEFSWVYFPKYCCEQRLKGSIGSEHDSVERKQWRHGKMKSKDFVPVGHTLDQKLNWLAGYLDSDGTLVKSTNGDTIQFSSTSFDLLKYTRLMLQEMGIHSSLSLSREEGEYPLPLNDGSGENGDFLCNTLWRVCIGTHGTKRLVEMGLKCERLKFSKTQEPQRSALQFIKVVSIESTGRRSDTFCFTEEKRNRGCFNGIVTGNCTEIMLPTDEDTTAVCCLSSVNLEKFEEWKDETIFIEDLMRMLDNVLSVFIKEAPEAMRRAVKSAENERSVGLGALGFHAFLQSKGVAFESAMASSWNRKIFKHIKKFVDEANIKLGVERGSCPDYAGHTGYPKRFSHTQAIAPNATSSIVCGNASPSIEPYAANAFTLKTHSGVFLVKNKHLDKLFKDKYGLKDKELDNVWQSVILSEGSVQHLDFLNDQEKFVFKTAMEIDQTWVIEHASVRQEFIDQGQSVNLFVHPEINKGDMHNLHKLAWKKGLKSLYYCRSKAVKGTEKISYSMSNHGTDCKSCEG